MYTKGQILKFIQAKGTPYERPVKYVSYIRPYFGSGGGDEHVVYVSDDGWGETAVLAKDLSY